MRKIGVYILLVLGSVFILATFNGCRKVGKTVEIKENVKVTYRDTTIVVPGQIVSAPINYDSLKLVFQQYLNRGLKPQIIYRNTPNSPTILTIKMDSLGMMRADCETSEQFIKFQQKEIERLKSVKERIVVHVTPSWVKWMLTGLGLGVVGLVLLKGFKII